MRFSKVGAVAVLAVVSLSAHAAELIVSTSGNDANPGTLSAPFRTIGKAASVAQPGDVVSVRGGVYNGAVTIASKGTASARVTFRSYPGERAILDGTGLGSTTLLVNLSRTEYVDFTGFEVRNAPYIGVNVRNARSTRIAGNEIHHSVRMAVYVGADSMGGSIDAVIEDNLAYNNVLENQAHAMNGGWAGTLVVTKTNGATIRNNRVYNNDGEAIIVNLTDNALVAHNTTWDNFSQGVFLDNARYTTVDSNLIYSTGNTRYFRDGWPGQGITVANETYAYSNPSSDNRIINNIVVGTRWGFYYGSFESGGGLKNTRVSNNTFHRTAQEGIRISSDTHANSVIENNIVSASGLAPTYAGGGVTFRNNNWYGVNAGVAAGAGDVIGNPAFTNPNGYAAGDYRLNAGSAAIAAAIDTTSIVKTDYFGTTRTLPLDIGAHQYSAGTADTQAPSVPAGLAAVGGDATSLALRWNASTDNVGVTGYTVYRDGNAAATVATPSWTDRSVVSGVLYTYTVVAFDAAGNRSAASAALPVAWSSSEGTADTQAPSAPSALYVAGVTSSSATIAWNAATDNTGVTAYRVYQDGVHVATTSGTVHTAGSLQNGRTYSYFVVAVDAAGNVSAASNAVLATTQKNGKRRTAS
jgi:chitodextrinase